MEWFNGLDKPTKGTTVTHMARSFGWLGVCSPIKGPPAHGLHRKSLEQNTGLMLQKQKMHFAYPKAYT
jgi:hypothetical protein